MDSPKLSKARIITTHEGRFISVEDIKNALNDDQFMLECAVMLKIGRDKNAPASECISRCIGYCVATLAGDVERIPGPIKTIPPKPEVGG